MLVLIDSVLGPLLGRFWAILGWKWRFWGVWTGQIEFLGYVSETWRGALKSCLVCLERLSKGLELVRFWAILG